MPNQINANGLTVMTRAELVAQFTAAFQAIYGADINLDSDTPDGQMLNIFVQAVLDQQDLLVQIYNQFDPDNAIGTVLDQRVAINGIQRQAGTYTKTNVTIVASQALNLYGLDQSANPVYTVADNAGNKWLLEETQTIASPGSYVYSFRAEKPGAVLTIPNTITVPVSVVLGVTSINNPTTYTTLGINEESDAALKIRRQKSVSLSSQGYLAGLLAALLNINGVTSAFVYENNTGATDADGIPSHSIWVIVQGGTDAEIAQAIYNKRNAGVGMKGAESVLLTQVDGTQFEINWDYVTPEDLFIKFTATSLNGVTPPNIATIRSSLPSLFTPGVNDQVNVNDLATLIQTIDPNCLVTNAGFDTVVGGTYDPALSPTSKDRQFVVSSAKIIILPMQMSPSSATVAAGGSTQIFQGVGGYGAYTYTVESGGGSINAASGLYTSGVAGTDVVRATDSLGNFVEATVTVT